MKEPSVLDYIKSLVDPRRPRIPLPWVDPPISEEEEHPATTAHSHKLNSTQEKIAPDPGEVELMLREAPVPDGRSSMAGWVAPVDQEQPQETFSSSRWPWLSLAALALALLGQNAMEPPERNWQTGVTLYLVGAALMVVAYFRKEWQIAPAPRFADRRDPLTIRQTLLIASLPLTGVAFLSMGGNTFTGFNVTLWLAALGCLIGGLWLPGTTNMDKWAKVRAWLAHPRVNIQFNTWMLLVLGALLLSAFFRFYQLNGLPGEMISDHAEKLWDVRDLLNGEHHIFFTRNTGREPLQFYLTAAIAQLLGTGISFLSLKLGTVTSGMVTLIFIYLLGKEVGNRRVGLLAMVFTGIAYWPNVISRFALRFAFYPLFTAPTLYYLVRGVRRQSRNDFILAGVWLGLGLHGYSSFRAVPILIVIAAGLAALHHFSVLQKPWFWIGFSSTMMVSGLIFLPLLRFMTETPDNRAAFSYRFLTRVSGLERPLPGPAGEIFFNNLWRAVTMMAWDDGETWVHSVVNRPALDVVSAALFYLGVVLLFVRYLTQRDWLDIFWIVSIPVLLLPSILSLAFPAENPSLNRPGGAYVPVFLIMGLALDGVMTGLEKSLGGPKRGMGVAWGLAGILLVWSSFQNYQLVFVEYARNIQQSLWNTTELGGVMRGFVDSQLGELEGAWVVIYPHWVDTRLVSINAGDLNRDSGLPPEQVIPFSETYSGSKLFMINPQALDVIQNLQNAFPDGLLIPYQSKTEGKDFWIFFIAGNSPAAITVP